MARILIIGPGGQIGHELCRTLAPHGEIVTAGRRGCDLHLDLGDPGAVRDVVTRSSAPMIINAAAYTAVDQAESEPERAFAVNRDAPGVMAETVARNDALLIHFSTDYVFDGASERPYTEADTPAPVGVYARSKHAGEQAVQAAGGRHLILRTSWVYGMRGRNFLLTVLKLARERESLRIVDDQFGVPNWCGWIAEATAEVVARLMTGTAVRDMPSGVYHLSATGETSWHGFASAVLAAVRDEPGIMAREVVPITTAEYPTAAARPARSTLDGSKLGQNFEIALPHWRECLARCLAAR